MLQASRPARAHARVVGVVVDLYPDIRDIGLRSGLAAPDNAQRDAPGAASFNLIYAPRESSARESRRVSTVSTFLRWRESGSRVFTTGARC